MEYSSGNFSYLKPEEKLGTSFDYLPAQQAAPQAAAQSFLTPDVARATAYGAQSGGMSGALTSGGVTSLLTTGASTGNVAAIGGGLILSQIEAAQKAKAQKEQEEIAQAKEIKNNQLSQLNRMTNMRFGV